MNVKEIERRLNFFKEFAKKKIQHDNINLMLEYHALLSEYFAECGTYMLETREAWEDAKADKEMKAEDIAALNSFHKRVKEIHGIMGTRVRTTTTTLSSLKEMLKKSL